MSPFHWKWSFEEDDEIPLPIGLQLLIQLLNTMHVMGGWDSLQFILRDLVISSRTLDKDGQEESFSSLPSLDWAYSHGLEPLVGLCSGLFSLGLVLLSSHIWSYKMDISDTRCHGFSSFMDSCCQWIFIVVWVLIDICDGSLGNEL